jgi:hypothetical protein
VLWLGLSMVAIQVPEFPSLQTAPMDRLVPVPKPEFPRWESTTSSNTNHPAMKVQPALLFLSSHPMKLPAVLTTLICSVACLSADVPSTLNYQGRVLQNGQPFDGTGHFVFGIYEGSTLLWTNKLPVPSPLNDPTVTIDSSDAKSLTVRNGVFTVRLGDGDANNAPVGTDVFFKFDGTQRVRTDVKLKVWFSPAAEGPYIRLDPDITFASVPFAQVAGVASSVQEGAIGMAQISPSAVGTGSLATGAVTSEKIGVEQVTGALLAADSVSGGKIQGNSIDSSKVVDGSLTGSEFAGQSIAPDRLKRDFAFFWDQKAYNEHAGAAIAGAQTRTLNQSQIHGDSISRIGNQIHLVAGTYIVRASAPAYDVNFHQIYLWNYTDGSLSVVGSNAAAIDVDEDVSRSMLEGVVEVSAPKAFEIKHFTRDAQAPNGLGFAKSSGSVDIPSIYTQVYVERVK